MPKKSNAMTEQVGRRLKTLRVAMGYATIRAFAADVGVNEDRYDKWEKGKALIPPEVVEDLKRSFGVTSDWIYFGEESALPRTLYADLRKAG